MEQNPDPTTKPMRAQASLHPLVDNLVDSLVDSLQQTRHYGKPWVHLGTSAHVLGHPYTNLYTMFRWPDDSEIKTSFTTCLYNDFVASMI
jgi:hypothetical protein